MLNIEDLKRLLEYNHDIVYGKAYLNVIDKSKKVAVIDDSNQLPIVFVHCYNYNEREVEELSKCFDVFFYHKLPEFHLDNKIVLMFIDTSNFVKFLMQTEEQTNVK